MSNTSTFIKENKRTLFFSVFFTLIPLLTSSSVAAYAYYHQSELATLGWPLWLLAYVLFAFTMAFGITPTTFVAVLGGFFLGWSSLFPMLISYLCASSLCYFFARRIDGGKLLASLESNPKVSRFLEQSHQNELALVISSKVSPILPFAVSNFLLALLKIRFGNFLLGCLLGMLPRTCLALWAGSQLSALNQGMWSQLGWQPKAFMVVLVILAFGGFIKIFRK